MPSRLAASVTVMVKRVISDFTVKSYRSPCALTRILCIRKFTLYRRVRDGGKEAYRPTIGGRYPRRANGTELAGYCRDKDEIGVRSHRKWPVAKSGSGTETGTIIR